MNQALAAAPVFAASALPAIGAPLEGGYFTGITIENGQMFANVTAGATGELRGKWNESLDLVAGAMSRTDGLSNTQAMAAAGSELALAVLALTTNGFSDWSIPARDQQELQYRHLKPTDRENYADGIDGVNPGSLPVGTAYTDESPMQTTVENFRAGGADAFDDDEWYWSSTQHADYPAGAWGQVFDNGGQGNDHKSYAGAARAVRRLPIQ
ncbi:DUF1566 domain-containing protein [Duganella violaceipulchra]|uniref:DUF1566 domain-containing protein n=1 Tax=Duganella violaceipulchra TaxID=2849652 RepID=A0AA41L876_9BURK|nr:DUF1566 domain-containing protein [Duganella violaceicalia]MBV6321955.1 DUF1566 domain-containing protein [Duganella violaceicalia]MCP2007050.1 hypothetical protein [Duganella violaceicalia]